MKLKALKRQLNNWTYSRKAVYIVNKLLLWDRKIEKAAAFSFGVPAEPGLTCAMESDVLNYL